MRPFAKDKEISRFETAPALSLSFVEGEDDCVASSILTMFAAPFRNKHSLEQNQQIGTKAAGVAVGGLDGAISQETREKLLREVLCLLG